MLLFAGERETSGPGIAYDRIVRNNGVAKMKHRSRLVLGLNSGTSADGVDAVACEIRGRGLSMRVKYVGHVSRSYPRALRERLMAVMAPAQTTTEELCRLNTAVGEAFARTAELAIRRLGLKGVDLIGSHGQTICHLPPSAGRRGKADVETGSLQIGDAAIIAARIGTPVVSGFRQADMAVGGQGAPLLPWTDYVLFRDAKKTRVVQNIGGIANLTWLPAGGGPADVVAFDSGPGNMLIDAFVSHFSKGREAYDKAGRRAAKGRVREDVLKAMLGHPYLKRKWPKSCGREEFGVVYMQSLLKRFARKRIPADDWIATATRFTAECIVRAYEAVLGPDSCRLGEMILCGGGQMNRTLMRDLFEILVERDIMFLAGHRSLPNCVSTTEDYEIPIQAKEGVSFAMLAAARTDGVACGLPRVTGARCNALLGNLTGT